MTTYVKQGDELIIEIDRSDSFSGSFAYKDSTGTAVNLTGYTATLVDSNLNTIPATVTIPSPTNGIILVTMSSGQTAALNDKAYRLRITSGAVALTLVKGRLNVD